MCKAPAKIKITGSLLEELQAVSKQKGMSVEQLVGEIIRIGLVVEKNIDNQSKVLILDPYKNKGKTILIPTVRL